MRRSPNENRGLSPEEARKLELTTTPIGTRMRLRVRAGARKIAILGVREGALQVSVTAPPERGKANRAVLKLLARTLDLPASTLELVSGQTAREKTVFVPATAETILTRLG
jgi:uncharacterized protein (TIGR00251 family)